MIRSLFVTCLLFLSASTLHAEDWPQFRGPTGDGHYRGKPIPIQWGTDKNVTWKTSIEGKGWSSPVVWKDSIYLTTAVGGTKPDEDLSLRAIKLNAKNGSILWNEEIFHLAAKDVQKIHSKNSHASPTPIVDGKRLYVHFGHEGTAALDLKTGKPIWKKTFVYAAQHGNGGSPILVDNRMVFSCDGNDKQFLIALDQATGEEVWKTPRTSTKSMKFSFATPHLIETGKGKQIISSASNMIGGYDPKSGKELWKTTYVGWSLIQRPVYSNGLLFYTTGYMKPILHAVSPDAEGDVTSKIVWTNTKNVANTPSLTVVGDDLYMLSDQGFLSAMDTKTGKIHWSERLGGDGYSASPVYFDGKLWITSEEGVGIVVQIGKEFKELARNPMHEKTFASLVPVDGTLYIRTEKAIYRIDEKK